MSDDLYIIDQQASAGSSVTLSDDDGTDTLKFVGVYKATTDIRLSYSSANGATLSASGFYFDDQSRGSRLEVTGVIENAIGSNGHDFIQGNEFANRLYGDNLSSGGGLSDTLWGGEGGDSLFGGDGGDELTGDEGADSLRGDAGDDTITGGAGRDTIEGGSGADSLSGGSEVGDTLSYQHSGLGVKVDITFGTTTLGRNGDAEGDRISGFLNVTGSALGDRLIDTVAGTISFGGNDNQFNGGGGNDYLGMGGGNDTAMGGSGKDSLFGGLGDDSLNGGQGADLLQGGLGRDLISGGGGADVFQFKTTADTAASKAQCDVVQDFKSSEGDKIDLHLIDAKTGVTGNQTFTFIADAAFDHHKGQVRFDVVAGGIRVYGDVNGDATADFQIFLAHTALPLVETDFTL